MIKRAMPNEEFDVLRRVLCAVGSSSSVAGGLGLLWLAAAPPQALRSPTVIVVAGVLLIAPVVGVLASGFVRRSLTLWRVTSLATVWAVLTATWLVVFPGARLGMLVMSILLGTLIGILLVTVVAIRRWRRHRVDAVVGVALVGLSTAFYVIFGGAWIDFGYRYRLDRVQARYETAIRDGAVTVRGGFVEGQLAGWVWADKLILDPLSGVIFDPDDHLVDQPRLYIGALGELADCRRLEPHWFHCVFS